MKWPRTKSYGVCIDPSVCLGVLRAAGAPHWTHKGASLAYSKPPFSKLPPIGNRDFNVFFVDPSVFGCNNKQSFFAEFYIHTDIRVKLSNESPFGFMWTSEVKGHSG